MLKASEFVLVGFDATINSVGLTEAAGRLAARLLSKYGDLVDDEIGIHVPDHVSVEQPIQLMFPEYGLLNITWAWARFEGEYPGDRGPAGDWLPERVSWAAALLKDVLSIQNKPVAGLSLELTWLLRGESSTARLVEQLGLASTMNGFFARADDLEVKGSTKLALPGLFDVQADFTTGRLVNYDPPEDIGAQIKYHSPHVLGDGAQIRYTPEVIDRFFESAPAVMQKQLERHFPLEG